MTNYVLRRQSGSLFDMAHELAGLGLGRAIIIGDNALSEYTFVYMDPKTQDLEPKTLVELRKMGYHVFQEI